MNHVKIEHENHVPRHQHQHVVAYIKEVKNFMYPFDFVVRSHVSSFFFHFLLRWHFMWDLFYYGKRSSLRFPQMGVEITCFIQFWNKQQPMEKHQLPFFCERINTEFQFLLLYVYWMNFLYVFLSTDLFLKCFVVEELFSWSFASRRRRNHAKTIFALLFTFHLNA